MAFCLPCIRARSAPLSARLSVLDEWDWVLGGGTGQPAGRTLVLHGDLRPDTSVYGEIIQVMDTQNIYDVPVRLQVHFVFVLILFRYALSAVRWCVV